MDQIKIEKPDRSNLDKLGVWKWPIWEKEASRFDWFYDEKEVCYFLEGDVVVTPEGGKSIKFGKGDLVTFPRGLKCTWDIKKAVRKHYNFE